MGFGATKSSPRRPGSFRKEPRSIWSSFIIARRLRRKEEEVLELYHNDMSTCAQKVRFALAEKGATWHSHHLDLRSRDQQKPEYLKLNPNAVVPTLVHDDVVIIESTVINEYVDDAVPGPALRPADAADKARMRLWTKQLDEGLHADTGVVSTSIAFRYQK